VRFVRLALLTTVVLLVAGGGDAYASKAEWSLFETPALIHMSPAKRNATLDQIKSLGADTLRIEFAWRDIARGPNDKTKPKGFNAEDPTSYDGNALGASPSFGPYDELVRQATARGLRILATVTGDAPRWATAGGKGTGANANYKVDATEYGKYAAAVAKRYSGAYAGIPPIFYYSIWNEPNHKQFLKPQSESPAIYRKLVDEGVSAIHANNKSAKVFVGETAPVGRSGKVIGPKAFLRKWLCLNKRFHKVSSGGCAHFKKVDADGYAHHPYGPVDRVPKKADIINLLAIRQLAKYLDIAAGQGRIRGHLPLYDTEFGLQSNPPDTNVSTSPNRQGQLINEKEEYHFRYGRLKSYSQYLLWDDPARKGPASLRWAGFQTGLRFAGGGPKPALVAYRLPLVVHKRRGGVYIWGHVRPGTGSRYVQIYRGGRKQGGRLKTNSRGYFSKKLSGSGKYIYKAYDGPGPKAKLFGKSRTARPV
jgi:hypothetical protein